VICIKHVCDFFDSEQSKNEIAQQAGSVAYTEISDSLRCAKKPQNQVVTAQAAL
jgi:hypothetical protein